LPEQLPTEDADLRAYSYVQTADLLGVSLAFVKRLVARGELRHRKVGRRVLIPATSIRNFLSVPETDERRGSR
jgi:excisionase family DNA binding protein